MVSYELVGTYVDLEGLRSEFREFWRDLATVGKSQCSPRVLFRLSVLFRFLDGDSNYKIWIDEAKWVSTLELERCRGISTIVNHAFFRYSVIRRIFYAISRLVL